MKTTLLLCLLLLSPLAAHSQTNDSLVVLFFQFQTGERPAFDQVELGPDRFDANGDGIAELIELELNDNDLPLKMNVNSVLLDCTLYIVDLEHVRSDLLDKGFGQAALANLRFERFLPWYPPGTDAPINPVLFSANGGIAIYDPLTKFNIGMPPSVFKLSAVTNLTESGWPKLIVDNNVLKTVEIYASSFDPDN